MAPCAHLDGGLRCADSHADRRSDERAVADPDGPAVAAADKRADGAADCVADDSAFVAANPVANRAAELDANDDADAGAIIAALLSASTLVRSFSRLSQVARLLPRLLMRFAGFRLCASPPRNDCCAIFLRPTPRGTTGGSLAPLTLPAF